MIVLFETPAGYAVFKLLDEKILSKPDHIFKSFQSIEKANKIVKLISFEKFEDTTQALAAATALVEGKMDKRLKSFLKKCAADVQEELLVADAKLGGAIKSKLSIQCLATSPVQELMRGIRSQMDSLIVGIPEKEMSAFALGLAHSLSRYKLKFSPDKVDTMIIQAVALVDDIEKELNNYNMRCREWYGWHFPELGKIVSDHTTYAKIIKAVGHRINMVNTDLEGILPEEMIPEVKEAAEISMGTEVSDEDILNIHYLCDQILDMTQYLAQLQSYLKNRMFAVAPNLTTLVGEHVGARLISHAGSLINLAKQPSSTVQILGAEKALFRALKAKHSTPKYGLLYHASYVNGASQKNKGKAARMLAAKCSLGARVDALGEEEHADLGAAHKANLEARMHMLETNVFHKLSAGNAKLVPETGVYTNKAEIKVYNSTLDSSLPPRKIKSEPDTENGDQEDDRPVKKVKQEPRSDGNTPTSPTKKKTKKRKLAPEENGADQEGAEAPKEKKKKKKIKSEPVTEAETPKVKPEKKKKVKTEAS